MVAVAVLALISMVWALKVTVPDSQISEYFSVMNKEGVEL
ncbi:hypothetical protein AFERRID_16750 [Acidithiobacillus ferridurans]|nr:hypothetical protein AFERRID_16750 [Acidithiobacillus ferridurans]